jgi:hypothetical protein
MPSILKCVCGECRRCKNRVYMRLWMQRKPIEERRVIRARVDSERIRANQRASYQRHKEAVKAKSAAWRKANPEKVKAKDAAWREANPEKVNAYRAGWAKRNPEKIKAKNAAWNRNNRDKTRAKTAAWRAANPEKVLAINAAWIAANPEKHRAHKTLNNAVHDGRVIRQPCEVCGVFTRVHGHHDDYGDALGVRWLCALHHVHHHRGTQP